MGTLPPHPAASAGEGEREREREREREGERGKERKREGEGGERERGSENIIPPHVGSIKCVLAYPFTLHHTQEYQDVSTELQPGQTHLLEGGAYGHHGDMSGKELRDCELKLSVTRT